MVTYKEAGVDIDAASNFIDNLQKICPDIGGFAGLYPLGNQYLVAGTDGVGTKLKIAIDMNIHHTIGLDLVAMCVNDILTSGAKPLFFLDYYAVGKLEEKQAEQVLSGIIAGCREAECVLLGGETAQMPGFYEKGSYDVAGFAVGIVNKEDLINGSTIASGDSVVGISSSGFHSNGFSLIRKIIAERKLSYHQELFGKSLGEQLLTPTKIYVKRVFEILKQYRVKGMAHITGGGIVENFPRIFPKGIGARLTGWNVPPLFRWLQEQGSISDQEMYRTYNMGIGYILVLDPEDAEELCQKSSDCTLIGTMEKGEGIRFV